MKITPPQRRALEHVVEQERLGKPVVYLRPPGGRYPSFLFVRKHRTDVLLRLLENDLIETDGSTIVYSDGTRKFHIYPTPAGRAALED